MKIKIGAEKLHVVLIMKKLFAFIAVLLLSVSAAVASEGTEKADKAIIVIDMQNDFVEPEGVLCVAGAKPTIPAIRELLDYGRAKWLESSVYRA